MAFYPLMFQMEGKQVLLVGGGQVSLRKFLSLGQSGAQFTAVSPVFCEEFLQQENICLCKEAFSPRHLAGADLVIAATDSRQVNGQVALACKERGILCCICDSLEESDVIFPAVVTRGSLKIAVSTCGEDPGLAKEIKQELEEKYPPDEAQRVSQAGQARRKRLGRT